MNKYIVTTPNDRPLPLNVFGTDVTVLAAASQMGGYGNLEIWKSGDSIPIKKLAR